MVVVALVARTGRLRQRYDQDGFRLVAGCIPYRYKKSDDACNGDSLGTLEVLMVTPHKGKGLLFPKGGWEDDETKEEAACREALEEAGVKGDIEFPLGSWDFRSNRHHDELSVKRKGYMFALAVTEQLDSWPEKDVRQRKWVTVKEAMGLCRKGWLLEALEKCVYCLSGGDSISISSSESVDGFSCPDSLSQLSDEEPSEQSACEEMVSFSADIGSGSVDAVSDDDAPSLLTEENANPSSD